jgi:tRNA pseudouridine38-40 synthase
MHKRSNIRLTIAYDGTLYLGWQKTSMGPSIESTLQQVIEQILQHPAPLQAASRTDAGVHALGQTVNFLTSKIDLDLRKFRTSLNRLLPKDIAVLQADLMPLSFHPTLDCTGKEYRYYVCLGPTQLPQNRLTSWHVHYPLDRNKMKQAQLLLIGIHHFAAFCNVKKNARYTDYVRDVQLLEMMEIERNRICFRIGGNNFLYKMVRNLVGTLIDIGRGKIVVESLADILQSQARPKAGVTAPSHGLFLHEVFYKKDT